MKDNQSPDNIDEHLEECSKNIKESRQANYDVLILLPDD